MINWVLLLHDESMIVTDILWFGVETKIIG